MWSKNTNGNLMIGKGKDRKRAEERKGGRKGKRGGETWNWSGRTSLRRFGGTNAHVDAAGAPSCPTNFPLSENISLYLQHYIESPLTVSDTLT